MYTIQDGYERDIDDEEEELEAEQADQRDSDPQVSSMPTSAHSLFDALKPPLQRTSFFDVTSKQLYLKTSPLATLVIHNMSCLIQCAGF